MHFRLEGFFNKLSFVVDAAAGSRIQILKRGGEGLLKRDVWNIVLR